ncbi:MAG TPA: hypothetical protein VIJ14_09415 [Rhabdochlamydiaceae bacterium]
MKVKVTFGITHTKEVSWWKPISEFPKLINYLDRNYKWTYTDASGSLTADAEVFFTETNSWDVGHDVYCSKFKDLFTETVTGCECGSIHTSFPKHHMFFCRLWSKN